MPQPIDRHLVDQLVVEHLPAALRVAQRWVGDADTAEDVMQEALCRVLRNWKSYRGEAAFSTWMMQIVVNVARDHYRQLRNSCELPLGLTDNAAEPIEHSSAAELGEQVRIAIDGLPNRQREVAMLKFGEGLETREIAEILNISDANVHACVHLIRKHIAKCLGHDYVEQD